MVVRSGTGTRLIALSQDVVGDSDGDLVQDTGEWFTYLGIIGLAVYAAMAVKRPAWAPSDLTLNIVSMAACALGGLLLAHPGDQPREGILQDATVP